MVVQILAQVRHVCNVKTAKEQFAVCSVGKPLFCVAASLRKCADGDVQHLLTGGVLAFHPT